MKQWRIFSSFRCLWKLRVVTGREVLPLLVSQSTMTLPEKMRVLNHFLRGKILVVLLVMFRTIGSFSCFHFGFHFSASMMMAIMSCNISFKYLSNGFDWQFFPSDLPIPTSWSCTAAASTRRSSSWTPSPSPSSSSSRPDKTRTGEIVFRCWFLRLPRPRVGRSLLDSKSLRLTKAHFQNKNKTFAHPTKQFGVKKFWYSFALLSMRSWDYLDFVYLLSAAAPPFSILEFFLTEKQWTSKNFKAGWAKKSSMKSAK